MLEVIKLVVTFAAGIAGGVTAKKMKFVPAAFMLGSLILVAVLNLSTGFTYFPYWLRITTQILAGSYLGLNITKENLLSLTTFSKPVILIMLLFFLFTLVFGFGVHFLCGIDLVTSLYCFAPGGVSDIGIIADSVGGDVAMITFMQLIRLVTVFIFYPFLFQILEKKGILVTNRKDYEGKEGIKGTNTSSPMSKEEKFQGMIISLSFSTIGGLLGYFLGMPAGAMVFAMAFAVIINLIYPKTYMPKQLRFLAQIMSGIYLALRITPESISGIMDSLNVVIIMIISVITVPILFGIIVHKFTKLELGTSLFCCTPGGMSEMTMLAEDMGLDFVKVSITHLTRAIIVISIFPSLINLIITLVN